MKLLVPVALALVGLGAGVGAGFALKPPPPEGEHALAACDDALHDGDGTAEMEPDGDHGPVSVEDCPDVAGVDPFEPDDAGNHDEDEAEAIYVPLEKPFVIPVFSSGEKVVSMVVVSLSVAATVENPDLVLAMEPRLRDRLLEAMFQHSNTGGFNGSFTAGRKIEDLKTALLRAAQSVMGSELVTEVLITEINRQDV